MRDLRIRVVRPVRPSVNTLFCDISVLSGGISMKLGKSVRHVSGHW